MASAVIHSSADKPYGELPAIGDSYVLKPEDIEALLVVPAEPKGNLKTNFELRQCRHCGGVHDRACPRVKRFVFSPTGSLLEVEFWREWDDSNVIYPEMLGVVTEPGVKSET